MGSLVWAHSVEKIGAYLGWEGGWPWPAWVCNCNPFFSSFSLHGSILWWIEHTYPSFLFWATWHAYPQAGPTFWCHVGMTISFVGSRINLINLADLLIPTMVPVQFSFLLVEAHLHLIKIWLNEKWKKKLKYCTTLFFYRRKLLFKKFLFFNGSIWFDLNFGSDSLNF